jgi:hypothetical protein
MGWMRRARLIAVVVVIFMLPGCAPKTATAADLITPNNARQVVEGYWTQNEKANMAGDPTLFEPIEAGPALTVDQAVSARNSRLNRHLAEARPLRKVTVYVPHQSRYPAEFAARIDTVGAERDGKLNTQPTSIFNLFEKASKEQAWKSTFFVIEPPVGDSISIAIGEDGYVAQVPNDGGALAVPPGRLGLVVADFLNAATAGMGVDDSPIDGAPKLEAIARNQKLAIEGGRRAGFTLTAQAASGPGGSHAYRSAHDQAVVFFAVSSVMVLNATRDGACMIQDHRLRLPPEVPPGSYRRVENKILALVIASDPPAGKGKAKVLGMTMVDYDFKVDPATGPCVDSGGPPATV